MSNIKIKNSYLLYSNELYSIYQVYMNDLEEYFMCLPASSKEKYKMIVDFPEEYFKGLLLEEKGNEIKKICDRLYVENNNYIYVLSNVTTYDLNEAVTENNDHLYENVLRRIQKYTYNAYSTLSESSIFGINIDQVITLITQTDDDKKFMNWLETNQNTSGLFKNLDLSYLLRNDTNLQDDAGWTTFGSQTMGGGELTNTQKKSNVKVKRLTPPTGKHGFSSLAFLGLVIVGYLIFGLIVILITLK